MKVTWDSKDFTDQISILEKMVESEKDVRRQCYLKKVLDATLKIYHETFGSSPRPKVTARQRLSAILDSTLSYSRYYSIVSSFFKETVDFFPLIDKISAELEKIDPDGNFDFLNTGATFSDNQILSLVDNFYANFDNELYLWFLEAFKDREHTVKFKDLKDNNGKTDGTTIFIDGVRKNFITIYRRDNVETYQCAVHEYGHVIASLINPEVSYTDRDDFFTEVASIFPELVALYENGTNEERIQNLYHLYTTFVTYIDSAEYLCLHSPVLNTWADNKYKMSTTFFNTLKKDYDIDEECFEETLSTTIEDDGIYVLSFIVAVELFHIYKEDKKKALEIFKNLLSYPAKEDILPFIIENIPINSHIGEELELLLQNFHKELKTRRC